MIEQSAIFFVKNVVQRKQKNALSFAKVLRMETLVGLNINKVGGGGTYCSLRYRLARDHRGSNKRKFLPYLSMNIVVVKPQNSLYL